MPGVRRDFRDSRTALDPNDLTIPLHIEARIIGLDRTEFRRKSELMFAVYLLIAKEQDLVLDEQCPDAFVRRGTQRIAQIDAADFGADCRAKPGYD